MTEDLKKWIRDVPDFPQKGILFRDITPALLKPMIFRHICDSLYERYRVRDFEKIAAVESRGFFFASVLAYRCKKGLIPLRKPGKLPWDTIVETYSLEYGEAAIEMHSDAVSKGDTVLIIDDLLATGGTAAAAARIIERQGGGIEELGFVIELTDLRGREKLNEWPVYSLLAY